MHLNFLPILFLSFTNFYQSSVKNNFDSSDYLYNLPYVSMPRSYVLTPNGNSVSTVQNTTDLSSSQIAECNSFVSSICPNAIFLSGPTNKYNCHSYAWYMQNHFYNTHWMPSPDTYVSDYSYTPIYSNVQVGDIICYINSSGAKIHSGRINQVLGGTSNNVCGDSNLYQVTSKFGMCGLYSHRGDECPYTSYYSDAYGENLATSVQYFRISSSHSHSLNYISHSNYQHFVFCSCSMAYYENHDWESNNKSSGDEQEYVPSYTCTKCGRTAIYPY